MTSILDNVLRVRERIDALGVAEDVPIYVAEHVLAQTQMDLEGGALPVSEYYDAKAGIPEKA